MAPAPKAARPAPTTPPISEWEEEAGMANFQVVRFHKIAARMPAVMKARAVLRAPGSV